MAKSKKIWTSYSMFLGKTLFCGKQMSNDFTGLSRCQFFDAKGRIFDHPFPRAHGNMRQALYGKIAAELKKMNKAFQSGKTARLKLLTFEKSENFFTRPDKFCIHPEDKGDDFYEEQIGALTHRQKELGITPKQIFDITELLIREYRRIEKLQLHLEAYGDDIFDHYIRGSWPSQFVRPLVNHLLQSAKAAQKGKKIKFLDDLTLELIEGRITGIQTVAADGNGLTISEENWKLFLDRRLESFDTYWSKFCTAIDIYDNRPDTAADAAREIAAIVINAKRYRDKKWMIKSNSRINKVTNLAASEIDPIKYGNFLLACRIYMDQGLSYRTFDENVC